MRTFYSLLPTLTAFIAFILGILCLFAGTSPKTLASVDLFTLYTPTIGNDTGMHDYYSIYTMAYCEGYLLETGDKNLTGCSNRTMLFSFDPARVFQEEIGNGTSLSDIGWPRSVTEDFHAFHVTSRGMGVFYCIGVGFAGLAMLERLWWMITNGPRQSVMELSSLLLSFTMFSIASIIATVVAFQFVDLINSHGDSANVTAEYGRTFVGMSWAAVGMSLVGSIASLAMVMLDRLRPGVGVGGGMGKPAMMEDSDSVRSRA
ncbi:actin cortical patch SUR7/pH-response regulator pali [Aspergillus ambiguus]|uniref:SUR7/PalI family protein n=1 Tax=Aspergillus ambiguus TaxID=176160 RepID=UPI003CCD6A8C